MGMLITACASLTGIHSTFRVQATLKAKDVEVTQGKPRTNHHTRGL